ncbi:hypothetical protein SNE40_002373 [Patella caerulea]|uniref:STAS domain-containing protein n=2 Tax=Patella caerulea TaxID=87958 RepID=A0AAN8K5X5_PATCE
MADLKGMRSPLDNDEHQTLLISEEPSQHYGAKGTMEMSTSGSGNVQIKRRLYNQRDLDRVYRKDEPEIGIKDKIKGSCSCSPKSICHHFLNYFPIIGVLRHYKLTKILVDVLAGLSAGFMHLPQGLGFGLLASLQPVYGLYSTFYPILLYVIFGTSPHVSFGTNAVLAVLTASIVEREAGALAATGATGNSSIVNILTEQDILEYKVGVAMAVTFLAGIILLAMGLMRLGFLTSYLSVSFIGGFTTASAIHIATSQVSKMLNIKVLPHAGAGKLVKTYIEIFTNITQTNIADLVISVICVIILLLVKICINQRFKAKLKFPVPIDLLIVIVGTIISHFADLNGRFGVAVVGSIPTGMPVPRLPNFDVLPRVGMDSFVIAILAFALTIAMAKLMARLNEYEVDDNQELVAYGMCNFVSSFFLCFPSCVAPPRTMILHTLGTKSTLNGITSAVFILIVLLAAGPLFVSLPVAVLAAMIVVAMKELLLQVTHLPEIWRVSKPDFVIWLMTLLVSVFVDLDIGIVVGIGISILTVIIQNQLSSGYLVGSPAGERMYLDKRFRNTINDVPGVKIFAFDAQLFFANAERFKKQLYENVFHPATHRAEKEMFVDSVTISEPDSKNANGLESPNEAAPVDQGQIIHFLIIDCSRISYIDIAGINILKQIVVEFGHVSVDILLARVPKYTLETLERSDFFVNYKRDFIFYDIVDAVEFATHSHSHDPIHVHL